MSEKLPKLLEIIQNTKCKYFFDFFSHGKKMSKSFISLSKRCVRSTPLIYIHHVPPSWLENKQNFPFYFLLGRIRLHRASGTCIRKQSEVGKMGHREAVDGVTAHSEEGLRFLDYHLQDC